MFKKKLEFIFISTISIALFILAYNFYTDYTFKHNDISDKYKQQIKNKEKEILINMQKNLTF